MRVYLTDEGRDIIGTLTAPMERFERQLRRGFSERELDGFLAHLRQIIVNVAEIGPGLGDRFGLLPQGDKDCAGG